MATILGERFPILTLKNGITVTNYGSNHEYKFTTGEILGKCSDDVCHATELTSDHSGTAQVMIDNAGSRLTVDIPDDALDWWGGYVAQNYPEYKDCKMWLDVFINYQVGSRIMDDILMIAEMDIIDIILVPYPLMNAWSRECRMQKEIADKMDNDGVKEFSNDWEFALLKMRTCKLDDRVTKVICSDRFCGNDETLHAELKRNTLPIATHDAETVVMPPL
jgi:hypothetical protein